MNANDFRLENTATKIGVWMDYSVAYLMEFSTAPGEIKTIESKFIDEKKTGKTSKADDYWRTKEKTIYFKKIINIIANYDEVLLFGPFYSKYKISKLLEKDIRFQNGKVILKPSYKMTTCQQKKAFVKGFYANS